MRNKIIQSAVKLYEDFTGHAAKYLGSIKFRVHEAVIAVGYCDAVQYETVRDGKRERYIHKFRKGSRPVLAVSHDGKQLYLLAGAYKFTDRGIVDKG